MAAPLILYIDTTRKTLVANFLTTVFPGGQTLEQGDNVPVQLHFLQQNTATQTPNAIPYSYIDPATVTPVTMAIGEVGLIPTAGTFTVTFGAGTTAALAFNITAGALSTAINALASVIAAGGVTITGANGGPFTIVFTTAGVITDVFAVGSGELVPPSLGLTARAVVGAVGIQEVQVITLVQAPAAVQNTWTPTYGAITVTRLQAGGAGLNEIQQISIPIGTYAGGFSLKFGAQSTNSLAYNVSAAVMQAGLNALATVGANNTSVIQVSPTLWNVTFVGALSGLSQSLIVANSVGLQMPMYLTAQLNLNVQGIFTLLTGLTTVVATLQIQQGTTGNINTVTQIPVTLNAALILGTPAVPNPADPWQTLSQVMALIAAYMLPTASTTVLGGVKIDGTTITISGGGVISSTASAYTLPFASVSTLGGVVIPAAGHLVVDGVGELSVPIATSVVLGVVKGDGSTIALSGAGVISVVTATAGQLGAVKPDGATILISGGGVISVPTAIVGTLGLVSPDGTTISIAGGVLSTINTGSVTHTSGVLTASALVVGNGTGDIKVLASLGTTTTVLHGNAAGLPTFGAVVLTTDVSGTLPIANGGTNGGSAAAGFNNLSPVTLLGDLIYGSAASTNSRLAGNITAVKQFLTQLGTGAVSAAPIWGAIAAGDLPLATIAAFGAVKGDNSTITLTAGTISVTTATAAQLGAVKPDGTTITIAAGVITAVVPAAANPTGTVGLAIVNGAATTFLRSDGAPALSQAIIPTWTGLHTFTQGQTVFGVAGTGNAVYQINIIGQTGALGGGYLQITSNATGLGRLGTGGQLSLGVTNSPSATDLMLVNQSASALTWIICNSFGAIAVSKNVTTVYNLIQAIGDTRVTADFPITSSAVLTNITGLTATLVAGQTYSFEATLHCTANVASGVQFAIAGTATVTSIIYEGILIDTGAIVAQTRAAATATSICGVTTSTVGFLKITGTITVNAAGTLTVQFAQNVSGGSASTVLRGSKFRVWQDSN